DPSALPKLDREADVARQLREKRRDGRQLDRSEIGPELDEDRTEFGAELARAVEEFVGELVDVAEAAFVGDFLRELERKGEIIGRPLRPAAHGLDRGNGVERRVDLDGIECAGVDAQKFGRAGGGW